MDKNKLINEIVDTETEWIKELAILFEYGDVDGLIEKHLHTKEEWEEAIDKFGIESAAMYRDTLKKYLKAIKEDTEFGELILWAYKEQGIKIDDVPKQPLI